MSNRRNFIRTLLGGMIATGFLSSAKSQNVPVLPSGETDWDAIRGFFKFYPDHTYLNAASLGIMPDQVVDGIRLELEGRSRKGSYNDRKNPFEAVGRFINAPSEGIALTHNTTEGINIVAQGLKLPRRAEVIISSEEHVGNALPWLNRARRDGIRLRVFRPAPTAAETLERISSLINRRTAVIAVPHITCTTGQRLPVADIVTLAKSKGILTFIDGAHGPGALALDMKALDCDFYAACGHKWLCGPMGSGFLYVKPERLEEIDPIMVGAYSDTSWSLSPEQQSLGPFHSAASRFSYGTHSNYQRRGLVAAIEFIESIGLEAIQARHKALHSHLRNRIESEVDAEILTPGEMQSRSAVLGFRMRKVSLDKINAGAGKLHIRLRTVKEGGLNSLRISPHIYNNFAELDYLVEFLKSF